MSNKRGEINWVLISLVMGVIVLVVLVLGFATNWQVFSSIFPTNNVDAIKTQCQTACATNSIYGFCTESRTLKANDLPEGSDGKGTCQDFSGEPYSKYGIVACASVSCPAQ